jgi:hypothetical protein
MNGEDCPAGSGGSPPALHGNSQEYSFPSRWGSMPFFKMDQAVPYLLDKPFQVMDWPGNSLDLNPIKNAWTYMKNKLNDQDISSVPKLKEAITKMWTMEISVEYLRSLSDSMPRRMEEVIKNGGT